MTSQLVLDERAARRIEAIYHIGDAVRRRRLVRAALAAQRGERILDVGCGPGFYCAELLEEVGLTARSWASTPAPPCSGSRCAAARATTTSSCTRATRPRCGSPTGSFDAAISVQEQEYLADVDARLAELHRALRPGGRVVVFDIDWETLSLNPGDGALTARMLAAWRSGPSIRTPTVLVADPRRPWPRSQPR